MNSLTREGKFIVFGILAIIIIAAVIFGYSIQTTKQINHIPSELKELYENCAKAEIPETELDTTLDQKNKFAIIRWWDDKNQKSAELKLPYYPATNFEGCSKSAKKTLRHIQEAAVPQ